MGNTSKKTLSLAEAQTPVQINGSYIRTMAGRNIAPVTIDLKYLEKRKPVADKKHARWLKLARFGDEPTKRGCLRNDSNVLEVYGCELDYDSGELSFANAHQRLEKAGVQCLLYTSASHTPQQPKWRVLAPFKTPLMGMPTSELRTKRKAGVAALESVLGIAADPVSYTLSQGFLYGRVQATEQDYQQTEVLGKCIDEMPAYEHTGAAQTVAVVAVAKPQKLSEALQLSLGSLGVNLEPRPHELDIGQLKKEIEIGNPLHQNIIALGKYYASRGLDRVGVSAEIASALASTQADPVSVKREQGDLERTLEYIFPEPENITRKGPSNFTLTDATDIELSPPDWLVSGYFEKGTINWLYGETETMKTFILLDLAVAVAGGADWVEDAPVAQGSVVYVCGEGAKGIRKRLAGMSIGKGVALPKGLHISSSSINFAELKSVQMLATAIGELPEKPVLVIVDTLARNMGGTENGAEEINTYYRHVEHELVNRFGCAVITAHHPGKNAALGMRGSAALKQNADAVFSARLTTDSQITTLTAEKMKDAAKPAPIHFEGVEVKIPNMSDNFDRQVTTLYMKQRDTPISETERRRSILTECWETNPTASTREVANKTGISQSAVHRYRQEKGGSP